MPFNIKSLLNDTQVQLERATTDKFGAVVDDFVKGGLGGFGPKVDPAAIPNRNEPGSWHSTSYAAALAGQTDYRPKLKFLFKVEFIFTQWLDTNNAVLRWGAEELAIPYVHPLDQRVHRF